MTHADPLPIWAPILPSADLGTDPAGSGRDRAQIAPARPAPPVPPALTVLAPLRIEAAAARRGATSAVVRRTGMGPQRSRRAATLLAATLAPDGPVAVVGVAGALAPTLRPGDVVVAASVASTDGTMARELPGAEMVAAALGRAGLTVHVGPVVSSPRPVRGDERTALAAGGALAVDMESAWLAGAAGARPLAVVRIVLDTPDHELVSVSTLRHVRLARHRLAAAVPVLERWAAAAGPRRVVLAAPRSFCAGVERAIEIVERALDQHGAPVYVRRQIVHNAHVVRDLERRGAVFVDEVDDVPAGATVVLAAHGVTPAVRERAAEADRRVIDATCPLVAKVHTEARRFAERDFDIVLIGHGDHEEVEGTLGEAPERITVIDSVAGVATLDVRDPDRVAFLTQTTLAVDEVEGIVAALRARYPAVVGPRRDDICYATQNRQEAVTAIAPGVDVVLVVGSANSSNSRRLTEVAERAGTRAHLIDGAADVDTEWLVGVTAVGVTAGASAPEDKVREVLAALGSLGPLTTVEHRVHDEDVSFPLPLEVR